MRVLLANKFHWRKGGSETYYFSLAEGLRELGHEVFFFSMQDERNEPCAESEFFVTNRDYSGPSSPLRKVSAAASLIYSPEAKRKFQALCEKVRPDVVHLNLVHRQITLSILDAPYLKKHHVPVVFTAHDYILVCPNYLMLDGSGNICRACLKGAYLNCVRRSCVKASRSKSLLAAAEARFLRAHRSYDKIDRIISPSQFLADVLVEGGFDSSKVVVMRNFISPSQAVPSDGTPKRPYFLCFGRLSKEKGVDLLIKAFAAISEQLPDWDLVIAGDGPERENLERMVATSACSRVKFTGHLAGEELVRLIGGASFACVCSRWYENMPYSILEALSLGVPVIGSNIGGIPEVVLDGQTGFLFRPGGVDSLRGSLLKAASIEKNASQFSAMRRSCRKLILDTCDRDAYVGRIVELYRSLGAER